MSRRSTGGRLRAVLFLVLSFAAAVIASIVIYVVIASYQRELTEVNKPQETVAVVVAAKDLWQGKTIEPADLQTLELPPAYVPDLVLRNNDQAVGRVPRERILAREFIRDERLADAAAGIGLNAIIPRGMRALAINISDGSSVSGFLNPGTFVDVLVTITGEQDKEAETVTLIQAVTVLAVNTRLGEEDSSNSAAGKPMVTLALTPDLAEKLTHAMAQGSVTLTLRNDIDVTQVETHGAIVSNLLGGKDETKRITIKEWTARAEKSSTQEVLMIMGPESKKETLQGNP